MKSKIQYLFVCLLFLVSAGLIFWKIAAPKEYVFTQGLPVERIEVFCSITGERVVIDRPEQIASAWETLCGFRRGGRMEEPPPGGEQVSFTVFYEDGTSATASNTCQRLDGTCYEVKGSGVSWEQLWQKLSALGAVMPPASQE